MASSDPPADEPATERCPACGGSVPVAGHTITVWETSPVATPVVSEDAGTARPRARNRRVLVCPSCHLRSPLLTD